MGQPSAANGRGKASVQNTITSLSVEHNATRVTDRIVEQIRRMIITLELAPGTMIDELALAARLDCSRTPVREALQRLAEERLVRNVAHRGTIVAELSLTDFNELIEVAVGVEGYAMRLAASNATDAELGTLAEILVKSEQSTAGSEALRGVELDYEFHQGILEATHNELLADTMTRIARLAMRFSYLSRIRDQRAELKEHQAVLDALRHRDVQESEASMLEHIENSRRRILSVM